MTALLNWFAWAILSIYPIRWLSVNLVQLGLTSWTPFEKPKRYVAGLGTFAVWASLTVAEIWSAFHLFRLR